MIPARKDFKNLICYFNVFALNICTHLGRQISDFVLSNLGNVVLYYLLLCIKMIERVKGKKFLARISFLKNCVILSGLTFSYDIGINNFRSNSL